MAVVAIPSLLRKVTAGQSQVVVPGRTVRQVIDALDEIHPGVKARLCDGDQLNPALSIFINGVIATRGLATQVDDETEIHFLPVIGGG